MSGYHGGPRRPRRVGGGETRSKRQARRIPPMEQAQLDVLVETIHPRLREFVLTAAWSGLRLFEVALLEARDVQEREGHTVLHVRHGKGDRERWSVIFEPGLSALRERWPAYGGLIFRNTQQRMWDRKSVNKHWLVAREKAGLDPELGFHSLRKFHATWLLDQGVSELDVAIQLGHFDRYGRPDSQLVREVYGYPDLDAGLARVAALRPPEDRPRGWVAA